MSEDKELSEIVNSTTLAEKPEGLSTLDFLTAKLEAARAAKECRQSKAKLKRLAIIKNHKPGETLSEAIALITTQNNNQ